MSNKTSIVRSVADLRGQVQSWRQQGLKVALVPTMGALHEGHFSLMHLGHEKADRVVTSIFVNPTQFGPGEDFEEYPRTEADDVVKLGEVGVELAFVPSVSEMYPEGFSTSVHVTGLTDVLCGAARPSHFDGVALIVTKLLLQAQPDIAIFGEKDFQQLQVIRRFVADLNIPVEILGGEILREPDGLALSSRNRYLTPHERQVAAEFPRIMRTTSEAINQGADIAKTCANARADLLSAGFGSIDYLEVRDTATLSEMDALDRPGRLFGAVRIGGTRLIDNWAVG